MATITQLRSGNYRIRKTYNGKVYSATLDHKPSQNEADMILFEKINKNGRRRKLKYPNATLFDAAEKYINIRRPVISPTTVRGYKEILHSLESIDELHETRIEDIDQAFIQKIINIMTLKGLSPKTVKNRISFIISVIREETGDFNPKITLPQQKKPNYHIPTDEEYSKLMDLARGSEFEIALYLAAFGLRRSEICGLSLKDVSDTGVYIHNTMVLDEHGKWIIKPKTKNRESERFVPIPEHVINLIRERGYIYNNTPPEISRFIHKCVKKLNIQDFSLHRLRHYFATKAHYLSIPEKSILHIGGWKTDHVMKTIYQHAEEKAAWEDIKKLQNHIETLTDKKNKEET